MVNNSLVEYSSHGIQINAVCPGTIETPMVDDMIKSGKFSEEAFKSAAPIKRLGKVEEIAETVLLIQLYVVKI
ncbi:SDR family oxidoreductase [Pedobacter gandavensis]|uniref:SDR family oxidoreductase n=1 Tax=Pedobacter gandavensis TaxID=2679963 RepID=A0ABR6ETN5_9SPHI|nr:SDR family oxidoreductase [Pedobacter gandavensis]